jgi:hypothetical protein
MFYVDSFIRDENLLKEIQNEDLWKRFAPPNYNWWNGWWVSNPRNIFEYIIENVWKQYGFEKNVAGFEYWSNLYPPGIGLEWHHDKDEAEARFNNKIVKPIIGMIYWVKIEDLKGGNLEVKWRGKTHTVEPKSNRLVLFNTGEPHRVTKVISGHRRAFLCNPWKSKPLTFKKGDHVDGKFNPVNAPAWVIPGLR